MEISWKTRYNRESFGYKTIQYLTGSHQLKEFSTGICKGDLVEKIVKIHRQNETNLNKGFIQGEITATTGTNKE